MAKTFDATLKGMLEESPGDWPVLAGLPRAYENGWIWVTRGRIG